MGSSCLFLLPPVHEAERRVRRRHDDQRGVQPVGPVAKDHGRWGRRGGRLWLLALSRPRRVAFRMLKARGNINVLVFQVPSMAERLESTGGVVPEFVKLGRPRGRMIQVVSAPTGPCSWEIQAP